MAGDFGGNREKRWGDTTSKRGEHCRVFVGNTDPKNVVSSDLEKIFGPYGQIDGIDVHANGFAFVQFTTVEDAQRACQVENGTVLYGKKLEIRMFDKAGNQKKKSGPPSSFRERSRSPHGMQRHGGHSDYHPGYNSGPMGNSGPGPQVAPQKAPPPAAENGEMCRNDIEIIVISKDQWRFGETIEHKLRQETGIQHIDILFLHSPEHINMTLNDLFERRTLYAVVIAPINEEHNSITLHILRNQEEHRNIPIADAIAVINRDYRGSGRAAPQFSAAAPPLGDSRGAQFGDAPRFSPSTRDGNHLRSGTNGSGLGAPFGAPATHDKRLPEDIEYVLRTTLSEGSCQFLSLQQIGSVIEYFTRERDRLASQSRQAPVQAALPFQQQTQSYDQYASQQQQGGPANPSNLLDNPQVKAALTSLLQIGAIGNTNNVSSLGGLASLGLSANDASSLAPSDAPSYMSTSSGPAANQYQSSNIGGQTSNGRRPVHGQDHLGQGSMGPGMGLGRGPSGLVGQQQPPQRNYGGRY